ncbi:MAG: cupredoxin family copper-binding protein [Thermoleophilaceae bacterium]
MRHLVLLASVYALVCALVVPGSILAQDEPAAGETTPAAAPPPPAPAPAQEPAPAPAAPAVPGAPAPPEPQLLADETAEAPAPQPKAIAAASGGVTIADFSFAPATLTISQGDTVTWVNNGPTPHSATANNGSFNTGILKAGQSASHTFAQAGTFSYFCQPHPFMKATIVVQAAQAGGTSGGSTDSGATGSTGSSDTGATASQADSGPTLPNTGGDSGPLLLLGGLLLVLGFAVHRRAAAE